MDSNQNTADGEKSKGKPGPKTPAGKMRSRLNSRKTGVFSKELLVTESERPDYEKIRNDLYQQLKPKTAVQQIAFENIIACTWRCVLALRLEGKRVMNLLADPTESPSDDNKPVNVQMVQWFASSRSELRNAIRFMRQLENKLVATGRFEEQDKEVLSQFFGAGFRQLLEQWPSVQSQEVFKAAGWIQAGVETFGMKYRVEERRKGEGNQQQSEEDAAPSEPLVAPMQQMACVLKLIEERRSSLEDLLRFSEQAWVRAITSANEFNPRYFSSASKDLRRAFDWFFSLRKRKY